MMPVMEEFTSALLYQMLLFLLVVLLVATMI